MIFPHNLIIIAAFQVSDFGGLVALLLVDLGYSSFEGINVKIEIFPSFWGPLQSLCQCASRSGFSIY